MSDEGAPLSDQLEPKGGGLTALKSGPFALFWVGHSLSSVGTKMQQVGLLWHIYELTGSTKALGLMGLVKLAPTLALVLWGGVIADRVERRKVLIYSQAVMGALAIALGVLSLNGLESTLALYAVAALTEAAGAFDGPSRKALIPQLVSPAALTSALTLTSITKNASKLVGPALMGLIVAYAPIGWVYLINGLSFAAVLTSLFLMPKMALSEDEKPRGGAVASVVAGARFLKSSRTLMSVLALDFGANLWAAATVLLPVYAKEVLHLGSAGYGMLASAIAAGGLLASALLLVLPDSAYKGRWVVLCSMGFGVGTIMLGLSQTLWVSLLALVIIGATDQVSTVQRNTIHQLITPNALRGRVTAINMIFSKSGPRLGELEAGFAASWLGLAPSIMFGGAACILTTALITLWHRPLWHRSEDQTQA